MLIRLNKLNRGMAFYEPPIEVVRNFDDIDRSAHPDQQIEALLWIPAALVCRFLHQFPYLTNEADELFSIGVLVVIETVKNTKVSGEKIGAHVHVKACAEMEAYGNNLNSVIKVATRTRYRRRNKNKHTPSTVRLASEMALVEDNETEFVLRDAAEFLGINLETATQAERERLAHTLGLEVK